MEAGLINPKNWSLNKKFASLVFIIILIPFASVGLLKEIEKTLVQGLQDKLSLTAEIIGSQLENQPDWFESSLLPDTKDSLSNDFYVFPLPSEFAIDGYEHEWLDFEQYLQVYQSKLANSQSTLSVLVGSENERLVLNLRVSDKELILPHANSNSSLNNQFDYLEIEYKTKGDVFERIKVEPRLAGKTIVKRIIKKSKTNPIDKIDWRYKVFSKNTQKGFSVELLFPSGIKPQMLKIKYYDVVKIKTKIEIKTKTGIGESEQEKNAFGLKEIIASSKYDLNAVVWPNKNFKSFVSAIKLSTAQRLWVLDSYGRVLSSKGDIDTSRMSFSSNPLLNWILSIQSTQIVDDRKSRLQLHSPAICSALNGKASSLIEYSKQSDQAIAVATYPIKFNNETLGVLLLEENVAKVQVLQKKTLTTLFVVNLVILIGVMWLIFWYVSRLVSRIKELKNAINQTVDNHGRIKVSEEKAPLLALQKTNSQNANSPNHGDELDQLAYSFKQMGERLFEYNDYLEKLASRLSHELRTPIAIVRSSLDNLLLNEKDEEQIEIIERALHGNQRLGEIISRMKDASGIKEAMQSAVKEETNLEEFLKLFIKGYELSYPKEKFELIVETKQCNHEISKDLFAEMLDKLISNAVSFSDNKQPIRICLEQSDSLYQLKISNSGKTIKKKNLKRIFRSLVSIRDKSKDSGANLGLGLYVVKLIADFHQAKIRAENLSDESGVVFVLSW